MHVVILRPVPGQPSDTETLGTLTDREPIALQRMVRRIGYVRLEAIDDTLLERLRSRAPRCGFVLELAQDEDDTEDWRIPGRPVTEPSTVQPSSEPASARVRTDAAESLDAAELWRSSAAARDRATAPAADAQPPGASLGLPVDAAHGSPDRRVGQPLGEPGAAVSGERTSVPLLPGAAASADPKGPSPSRPPSPGVVLACGLLLPGGGQLCLGEVTRALEVFLASVLLLPWPLGALRAARRATAFREQRAIAAEPPAWRVLFVALPLFWLLVGVLVWTVAAPVPEVRVVEGVGGEEAALPPAEGLPWEGATVEELSPPEIISAEPDGPSAPERDPDRQDGEDLLFPDVPGSEADPDDADGLPGARADEGAPSAATGEGDPLVAALVVEADEACRDGAHERCLRLAERALRLDPTSRAAIRLRITAMIGMQEAAEQPPTQQDP